MKNLFKNLMLVAVAAMAFTACQKDNGELDAPKRIVNFTANIGGDDTRSGFTDKGDNGYKSAWDGDETLFVKAENTEHRPTIDAEGKFSVEFSADDQFATFYSPVASWEYNTSYGIYMPVVPATQTPSAKSVDPAAHILQAQNVFISGSENINVTFEHAVAYGKMTVNTPAGFDISKVEINLVGAEYGVEKDLTYTINADNVENNVFWFATETLKVSEMTVTAYGKEGETDKIYSKTVTVAEGKLEFAYGHVGSFSVSNLTEQVEPISLSTMSTGASHNYGFGYTFTNDNDTNFTIVFSDWIATSSSINPGTYNVTTSVSYVNQLNVALDASKTYKFEGVSSKLSSGTISVAKDGETYTIEMSLVLNNGTALDYKYVGSLGGNSSEGGETTDPENPGEGGETPDPENPGEGGETSEDYTNWSYSAVLEQSTQIVTLTDKSGTGRVIEFKLNQVAITKFYGDPSKENYFTDVKVDGVAATATAESWFNFYRSGWVYNAEIDMTINGVHYSGIAESFSF